MNLRRISYSGFLLLLGGLGLAACQPTRNFTTYYNLFYNMERIMDEVEDEVLYIREQKQPEPLFYIPFDDLDRSGTKYYAHLERRSMTNDEMRANKVKLDSILIKGSKLMARHSKSDYFPDAVFYIGKAYFYLREWFQSQKKCEELIAGFPDSRFYPDAHLVLSMDLMEQGKIAEAERMLSRTIDIGWGRKRRDILIEAFRLNADLQLGEGNVAEAIRPYERALILSSDDEDRARWRYETGMIYYRQGDFNKALAEFAKVDDLSPDILTQFQTGMQRAAAYRALGRNDDAAKQLAQLRKNGNFEGWYGMVDLESLNLAATQSGGTEATDEQLQQIDSISPGKAYSAYAVYERAVRSYRQGDYTSALASFQKVQAANVPFQRRAARYAGLLARYFEQTAKARALTNGYSPQSYPDSSKAVVSDAYYSTARVFVSLDLPDSARRYYDLSGEWSRRGSVESARYYYVRAMSDLDSGRNTESDSLLQILVDNYGLTDYGADARKRLHYTEFAKVDTAEDLYLSGRSFMNVGDNDRALTQLHRVIADYPTSPYAPQAYYAIGLIYEQNLGRPDSAFSYYARIVDLYPKSEQASTVRPVIDAVNMDKMRREREKERTPVDTGSVKGEGVFPANVPVKKQEELVPLGAGGGLQGPNGTPSPSAGKPGSLNPAGGGNVRLGTPPAGSVPVGGAPPKNAPPDDKGGEVKPPQGNAQAGRSPETGKTQNNAPKDISTPGGKPQDSTSSNARPSGGATKPLPPKKPAPSGTPAVIPKPKTPPGKKK